MSTVEITHEVDGETTTTTIADPDFVHILLEVQEVSVGGRVFSNVSKVMYDE